MQPGCMKKPELEDDDGVPASTEQVQNAIVEGWGSVSPLTIGNTEFSYTEKEIAIGDLPGRIVFQEGKTVRSVRENAAEKIYTILQQTAEIDSENQQKLSTTEREVTIVKASPNISNEITAMTTALPLSIELAQQLLYSCVQSKDWNVKCFNLTTWQSTEEAPKSVAEQEGCQGLTDCKWNQKHVKFDMVLTTRDEKTGVTSKTKATYHVKFSADAPYLSRITEFCYEGIGSASNQQFPVSICQKIKNFRR